MNDELTPTARGLLARAKVASSPTSDDAARVLASLGAIVPTTAMAGTAAAKLGAGASGAAKLSGAKLLVAFVAAVGTGALSTGVVLRQLSPPAPRVTRAPASPPAPAPAATQVVEAAPEVVEDLAPAAAEAVVADETPAAPEPVPSPRAAARAEPTAPFQPPVAVAEPATPPLPSVAASRPEPGKPAVDRCDLSAELTSLRKAQRLLAGAPAEAIDVLDAWQRDCPQSALFEEQLAVRALALCSQARREAGRAVLLELRTRFPSSPAIERVERQCEGP